VSKRILLIDSDEGFAEKLSIAVQAHGFAATVATDSEQGLSIAKDENPDLIVVCVEAQPTNGYMLCTRLKKDEQLKSIPVILTSSHATADSFEKHKKLKTRAEEYLIKPFAPEAVLEKASQLLGIHTLADAGEDEILAIEDEPLGLGDLVDGEDEPISLSAADAAEARSALTEEPLLVEEVEEVEQVIETAAGGGDDELDMFDKAFDSIGAAGGASAPSSTSRFADPEIAPDLAPAPAAEEREPTELSAPEDDAFLDSLTAVVAPSAPPARSRQEAVRPKKELSSPPRAPARKVPGDAVRGDGDLKARIATLLKQLESMRAERDQLVHERDSLHSRLEELEVSSGQNEDRAVKAYARLKNDEKLREKARKALSLALQLLQDDRPDDDEDGKKVSAKA